MTRIVGFVALAAVVSVPSILSAQSVECLNGVTAPNPGRGAATDGRRIITVHIDSSWDVSSGHTDSKVWNGVVAAINELNNTTDQYGNKTGYYLQIDQSFANGYPSDFTITKGATMTHCGSYLGCGTWTTPGDIMLDPVVSTSGFVDLGVKVLAGHEIGHGLGLTRGNPFQSIMAPFVRWTDWNNGSPVDRFSPQTSGVSAADIAAINMAMMNPGACTGSDSITTDMELEDDGFTGGSAGQEEVYDGGGPYLACYTLWAVTYNFWRDQFGEWHYDYMTYDYVIRSYCDPINQ